MERERERKEREGGIERDRKCKLVIEKEDSISE